MKYEVWFSLHKYLHTTLLKKKQNKMFNVPINSSLNALNSISFILKHGITPSLFKTHNNNERALNATEEKDFYIPYWL